MRRALFALLSCAFVLALSACGSSDESVSSLLRQTFTSGGSVDSGKVTAQLEGDVRGIQGLTGPFKLRLEGPFESAGKGKLPRFDFNLGITVSGQSFSAGGVSTSDRGWLRVNGQAYAVPDAMFKKFRDSYLAGARKSGNKQQPAPSLAALGVDPRTWLRGARKAGEADIAGTKTIHITGGLNVARLLDDVNNLLNRANTTADAKQLPPKLTDAQRRDLQRAVRSASVDVYTGKDDKLLRRLDVRVSLQRSGEVQGGNLRFQLQLDALNQHQDIKAPAGAKPLDELVSSLRSGVLPGMTGSAGGSTRGGATAPRQTTDYLQCLQAAGEDVAKLQRCAALQGR
ncbi:MAG: hypothetical protein E6G10_12445 [Actinobacteria bacterium]|nr:MAG: hypothetical protein E6G10_12445 [Actinomycetota bacterium]